MTLFKQLPSKLVEERGALKRKKSCWKHLQCNDRAQIEKAPWRLILSMITAALLQQ